MLAANGSTENDGKTASRVYANAFRGCTTPSEWAHLLPLVKAAMGDAVYAAAVEDGAIDGPGLIEDASLNA